MSVLRTCILEMHPSTLPRRPENVGYLIKPLSAFKKCYHDQEFSFFNCRRTALTEKQLPSFGLGLSYQQANTKSAEQVHKLIYHIIGVGSAVINLSSIQGSGLFMTCLQIMQAGLCQMWQPLVLWKLRSLYV